ncbi:hypothetical protein VCR12J2_1010162 [Vibrio coralliirubri]|nr:hypothetical protein VCR12J2_1010162 [Vibrio coralliirubri]
MRVASDEMRKTYSLDTSKRTAGYETKSNKIIRKDTTHT